MGICFKTGYGRGKWDRSPVFVLRVIPLKSQHKCLPSQNLFFRAIKLFRLYVLGSHPAGYVFNHHPSAPPLSSSIPYSLVSELQLTHDISRKHCLLAKKEPRHPSTFLHCHNSYREKREIRKGLQNIHILSLV